MAKFEWQGRNQSGDVQKGVMEAANADAVSAKLRASEISPLEGSIKEKGGFNFNMELNIPGMEPGVTAKDIIIFTRQFATMIDAGLPLVQCLDLLAIESDNRTFKKVLYEVKETVESGSTFADALDRHPKVFDNLYVQMVKAGEIGGILDTILNRLALQMEKSARIKKQIKSAMLYPSIIMTVAVVVVAVLLIFVIPIFAKMFGDMGENLPGFTLFVMDISTFLVKGGMIYILIGVGILYAIFKAINKTEKGELFFHSVYLKIPVVGNVIQKSAVAQFARTLSTLISSGVPIMDGLEIVARVAGNRVIENDVMRVRRNIAEGKTLAEPLRESVVFPHMVVQMIAVGEQTGSLDTMLGKIADFYEEEVDDAVAALTSMMEPLLMVFIGITVGGVAIAMYLPIFSMVGNFASSGA